MATIKVLFRVDAGPNIGLGHLQRCLSLASALRRLDMACIFLTNGDRTVQDRVAAFGFESGLLDSVQSGSVEDVKLTLDVAVRNRCDALIVDSYHIEENYLERLRDTGFFVAAIDDLSCFPFPCQLVVNGGAHAHQLAYCSSSGDTIFLLGPRYALLGPEFWNVPPRMVRGIVQNVLVTLGGADPRNLMPKLLALLDDLGGNFSVTAVLGPFFDNCTEIERMVKDCRRSVRLVRDPDSMCDLILDSDLAISGGGQTLCELACVGCPTVAVRIVPNQDAQLRVLEESGFIRVLGDAEDKSAFNAIADAVVSLLSNREARAVMGSAGRRLIDGEGTLRVAQAIMAGIGQDPDEWRSAQLRISNLIDADSTFT